VIACALGIGFLTGFLGVGGGTHVDRRIVVLFTLAAMLASVSGNQVADRFSGETLISRCCSCWWPGRWRRRA